MKVNTGYLAISQENCPIIDKEEYDKYSSFLIQLYNEYGYKAFLMGNKIADIVGYNPQTILRAGFFPSAQKAIECHSTFEYEQIKNTRNRISRDFVMTLYGPPEDLSGDIIYKTVELYNEYITNKYFLKYKLNIDLANKQYADSFAMYFNTLLSNYGYHAFYMGMKVKDMEGIPSIQKYSGLGFFDRFEEILNCFKDKKILQLLNQSKEYTFDMQMTLFAPFL